MGMIFACQSSVLLQVFMHTHTQWAEAWALNHKKHITKYNIMLFIKRHYMPIQEVFDDYQYMLAIATQSAD